MFHLLETYDTDSPYQVTGEEGPLFGGKGVNNFIYDTGFHNGPRCVRCGKCECQHCDLDWELAEDCHE